MGYIALYLVYGINKNSQYARQQFHRLLFTVEEQGMEDNKFAVGLVYNTGTVRYRENLLYIREVQL